MDYNIIKVDILRKIVFSLLTGGKFKGIQDEKDRDALIRLIVLNITYLITSVLITGLGISDMRGGLFIRGLIEIITGVLILLNLLLLRTDFPFIAGGFIATGAYGVFGALSIKDRWLSRKDSYMNMIFVNSPDIIFLLDEKGRMVYCADVFLKKAKLDDFNAIRKMKINEIFSFLGISSRLDDIDSFFKEQKPEKRGSGQCLTAALSLLFCHIN